MDLAQRRDLEGGRTEGRVAARHVHGREERSTFPPEMITPSFGKPPSARFARFRDATTPGLSNGAMATALDGSMMIFMRSQTSRAAETISSSLTNRIRST